MSERVKIYENLYKASLLLCNGRFSVPPLGAKNKVTGEPTNFLRLPEKYWDHPDVEYFKEAGKLKLVSSMPQKVKKAEPVKVEPKKEDEKEEKKETAKLEVSFVGEGLTINTINPDTAPVPDLTASILGVSMKPDEDVFAKEKEGAEYKSFEEISNEQKQEVTKEELNIEKPDFVVKKRRKKKDTE